MDEVSQVLLMDFNLFCEKGKEKKCVSDNTCTAMSVVDRYGNPSRLSGRSDVNFFYVVPLVPLFVALLKIGQKMYKEIRMSSKEKCPKDCSQIEFLI